MIACSLNEVESYARRAARGAGMAWGLADEAAKATRWLEARGLPGTRLLARLAVRNDGVDYDTLAPVIAGDEWHAPGGTLCPVCAGAAISDRVAMLADGMTLRRTACPLLLAPFVARLAAAHDSKLEMRWEGVRLLVDAGGAAVAAGERGALAAEDAPQVHIAPAAASTQTEPAAAAAVQVPDAAWQTLSGFAHRTYVPASEASRTRGAGSGSSDND